MAELVASDLRKQIIRGALAEGASLPSESVLMAQFGVSRPTLREAFRVLEAERLIVVRRGAGGGGRVQSPSRSVAAGYAGLVLEHQRTTMKDVCEARLVLEPPTAGLLARRRTKADLARLEAALVEHETMSADPALVLQTHHTFHALVVDLAGNETLALLNAMLADILGQANWSRISADLGTAVHERAERDTVRSHRKLVELVTARDAAGAERVWRRHLEAGCAYLLAGMGDATVLDLLR
jgi:GntR family transcriptional regulator, transcriptional repressor for pyruvate dehydrogenase complex